MALRPARVYRRTNSAAFIVEIDVLFQVGQVVTRFLSCHLQSFHSSGPVPGQ
jgi:hypothetical protein